MRGPNKGPNGGGSYSNGANSLENGGEVLPTEPKSMTAALIASLGSEVAAKRGSESQASDADMRGGNPFGNSSGK